MEKGDNESDQLLVKSAELHGNLPEPFVPVVCEEEACPRGRGEAMSRELH